MIEILDIGDFRVSDYSLLKAKEENPTIFVSDHEKTVLRLLSSNLKIKSIFGTPKYISKHASLVSSKLKTDSIYVASEKIFESTIGFRVHQGFMAVGYTPNLENKLPTSNQILLCNSLVDSENMGSILRTSASFGLSSILLDEKCIHPYLRRSIRVSMGNIFSLNIQKSLDVKKDLKSYKDNGYKIISLSLPENKKESYYRKIGEFTFPEKFILILGNESNGISEELKKVSDFFVYIPMYDGVDSLNVSHSLAICLAFWKKGI
jgi:tRNA G18 (ribose-2'-O)-methylase SpoU